MRNRILFALVATGLAGGFLSAYKYAEQPHPEPPVFTPAANPFGRGIYATGIIESYQPHGQNTSMYPELAGVVTEIRATEGQHVARGDVLLVLDDSVQRATTEQLAAQADAARAALDELRAQPRKENLEVAAAQVKVAEANLATSQSDLDKQRRSYDLDPRSVSKQTLDNAMHAVGAANANVELARRQYDLTRAGAWTYDIRNQEKQVEALSKAQASADATLRKYTLRAPRDGIVLAIGAAVGSYVSPQGVYNPYTQASDPIVTIGEVGTLAVRCYIDEILVPRLPDLSKITARMFLRGTTYSVPLTFERVQPYVQPKIELSNERTEKVDLRVLPVIFRFSPAPGMQIYPGQLVDVYFGETATITTRDGARP